MTDDDWKCWIRAVKPWILAYLISQILNLMRCIWRYLITVELLPLLVVELVVKRFNELSIGEVNERVPNIALILIKWTLKQQTNLKINGEVEEVIGSLERLIDRPNQHLLVISIWYVSDHKRFLSYLLNCTEVDYILTWVNFPLVLLVVTTSLHSRVFLTIVPLHSYLVQVLHSGLLFEVKLLLQVPVYRVKVLRLPQVQLVFF